MSQPEWWFLVRRLREVHGMTYEAIGTELGLHHSAVAYACDGKLRERKRRATARDYVKRQLRLAERERAA